MEKMIMKVLESSYGKISYVLSSKPVHIGMFDLVTDLYNEQSSDKDNRGLYTVKEPSAMRGE